MVTGMAEARGCEGSSSSSNSSSTAWQDPMSAKQLIRAHICKSGSDMVLTAVGQVVADADSKRQSSRNSRNSSSTALQSTLREGDAGLDF
jgi:hypothetical protein